MQGIIKRGVYKRTSIVLTGDTEIIGGNFRQPRFTTMGLQLKLSHPVWFPEIDGSKDPADWGDNVIVGSQVLPHMLEPSGVCEEFEQWPAAVAILDTLDAGGPDAKVAYEAIIDLIQAPGGDSLALGDFITAHDALDLSTYSGKLLKNIVRAVKGDAWMEGKTNADIFAAVKNAIRNNSKQRLTGATIDLKEAV